MKKLKTTTDMLSRNSTGVYLCSQFWGRKRNLALAAYPPLNAT